MESSERTRQTFGDFSPKIFFLRIAFFKIKVMRNWCFLLAIAKNYKNANSILSHVKIPVLKAVYLCKKKQNFAYFIVFAKMSSSVFALRDFFSFQEDISFSHQRRSTNIRKKQKNLSNVKIQLGNTDLKSRGFKENNGNKRKQGVFS